MPSIAADPLAAVESLGLRVRNAVLWRSGGQLTAQGVQWGATFVVIRILSPQEYGLFAMTQAVLVLLNLANGYGMADALIQRRTVSMRHVRQLFGMLIALNVALAALQVSVAPLAAAYYRQPRIIPLLRVQALLYLLTPFIAVPYARLSRALDFRSQARATMASSLVGAIVALSGALAHFGVWTLIAAPIALFATRAVVLTRAAGLVRPLFDVRGAGDLARFGGVVAAGQLFWFVQSQADVIIAGRHFPTHALGLYSTALLLTQIFVSKVMPPLNEIAFAAYARLHADGGGDGVGGTAFGDAFVRATRLVMAVALPFSVGLAAVAPPLVATVLGDAWREAAPLVRIAALAIPFATMLVLLGPACQARGRPGIGVGTGAAGAAILVVAFALGVAHGPAGLAWAWATAYPIYLGVGLWRSLPVIGISAGRLGPALAPAIGAAVGMGLIVIGLDGSLPPLPQPARLAALVAVGVASYTGLLTLASPELIADAVALLYPPRRRRGRGGDNRAAA